MPNRLSFTPRHTVTALCLFMVCMAVDAAQITASRQSSASKQARAGEPAFRELYKELVEINTTLSSGSCTEAANAMKAHLAKAGYPPGDLHVIAPPERPKDGNLIAVLPGTDASAKPIMLLAHIDVVEARREDWERDPFNLTEEAGYFYARGAADDKAMAAIFTDAMLRFRQEKYQPKRGIKLALTCGEETSRIFNGLSYLLANHRALVDAAFALNEGGDGRLDGKTGKYQYHGIQAGEKLNQDFTLETVNQGGHSARPMPANAIYQLAAALAKIQSLDFPVEFNEATREYLSRYGDIVGGDQGADMKVAIRGDTAAIARLKQDPGINAMLHTTCVATMINGGHASNALPQRATANINCRIFPGHPPQEIHQTLINTIDDPSVKVTMQGQTQNAGPPPRLSAEIMGPIETLSQQMFPGVPVIPAQASGATDGRFLIAAGIPTYGVSGMFSDGVTTNAHGLNERQSVQSLLEGREFLYRLTKLYAGGR